VQPEIVEVEVEIQNVGESQVQPQSSVSQVLPQTQNVEEVQIEDGSSTDSIHEESDGLYDVDIDCDPRMGGSDWTSYGQRKRSNKAKNNVEINKHARGLFDDEWESDSEDEDTCGKFATFSMPKSMTDYEWEVGIYFVSKEEFIEAIRTYRLQNGRNLKIGKNNKKRVRVTCLGSKGKCGWIPYCAYIPVIQTWQLRKIVDKHTCCREFNNKLMNTKWLSGRIKNTVRENPIVKVVHICEKGLRKWNVSISRAMSFRARSLTSNKIDGSFTDQYKRIYDYAHELRRSNPGSTIKLKVEDHDGAKIFQRFYVCLKACKDSFVSCRSIIGLDGCFLKRRFSGELLTAVARDANDQMFPLAYAVVEVENKDMWSWFLDLLIDDLGGVECCASCTFVSDQQKVIHCVKYVYWQLLYRI